MMRTGMVRSLMVGLLALTLGIPATRGAVVLEKKLASISVSGKDSVAAGGKIALTATAKYDDGSTSKVTPTQCASSSMAVATVNSKGEVTGKKIGSAKITVSYTEAGVTKTAEKTIKVTKGLSSIAISGASRIAYKKTTTYTAHALFTDGSSAPVAPVWTSSNTGIATISAKGVVTGKKGGAANITASFTYGGVTKSAVRKITVTKKLTALSVSGSSSVDVGSKITLTATAKFDDGTTAKVTPTKCSSSNTSIATVTTAGVVTGKKAGSATITVSYTYSGTSKVTVNVKKTITVKKKLMSLAITGGGASVDSGKTLKFTVKAKYKDGSTEDVTKKATWSSSDKKVATVSKGVVTGKKAGTAKIQVSFTQGGVTKKVEKTVTVKKKLSSLAVSGSKNMYPGTTVTLIAKAIYTDGSKANVKPTWTSSNKAVATVKNGVVYGKKAGTVTIKATYSYGGVSKSVSHKITVSR